MEKYFLFVDTESSDLNYEKTGQEIKNEVLEISYILMDSNLKQRICEGSHVVKHDLSKLYPKLSDFGKEVHRKNNLLSDVCESVETLEYIDKKIANEISSRIEADSKVIIAGSSVSFDKEILRRFFPSIYRLLYYRILDVSSIKEVIRLVKGEDILNSIEEKKECPHRAKEDIEESIQEFQSYLKLLSGEVEVLNEQ